jgi:hypothetical protein
MGAVKSSVKLIAEVIVVLGALACVLVWLKVEPKDLKVPALGNWIWLALALILFAIGVGSSLRSWYLSAVRAEDLKRQLTAIRTGAERDLATERQKRRPLVERSGAIRSLAGQADWLRNKLEEIWHLYDSDRTANEALIYPLSSSAIPSAIREGRHMELWSFRVLYRSHIGHVKSVDPDFHSNLIDDGFPCDLQKYLEVLRKMEAHARLLRERADNLIRADVAGEPL